MSRLPGALQRRPRSQTIGPSAGSLADQMLQVRMDGAEFARSQIRTVLRVFFWLNGGVFALTAAIWLAEEAASLSVAGCDRQPRIVTDRTLLALIAASAAQLGVLAASMGKALSGLTSMKQ